MHVARDTSGTNETVVQHVAQHRCHGQNLRTQVADDAEENRHRREQARLLAAVAGRHRIRQGDGVAQLRHHAQPGGQQVERATEGEWGDDGHPGRAQPHAIDQPRSADEAESAHLAGEDRQAGHEDAEVPARHEEVARRGGAPQRPDPDPDADREIGGDAQERDEGAGSRPSSSARGGGGLSARIARNRADCSPVSTARRKMRA